VQLENLFHLNVIVPWLAAMIFGVFVGSTPGLTATMAVALIVPISYYMSPEAGIAMVIGVSFTAIFAGDIPATYLRIPGTPASAAATLDGHEFAKRGRARYALTINLICSCLGGLFGVTVLMLVAPQLAQFALKFSFFEYFWLSVCGLVLGIMVCHGSALKGAIAAVLGILFSTVGGDVISYQPRYTFGDENMLAGLRFIPAMIGLFGLSEVLRNVQRPDALGQSAGDAEKEKVLRPALRAIWKHKRTVAQSAAAGTVIGALPGAGADIAAWGAYGISQKTSRHPEKFGQGAEEGVIAPTSANNAAVAGAWIPALVFGIPGDAVTAIVLGALTIFGIQIGSSLFDPVTGQGPVIFRIALITQLLLLPAGYLGIRSFGLVMRLPRRIVLVSVIVFSVVGSYALYNNIFDVYVMFAFGLLGYFLETRGVPLAPLILGMILGPLIEDKLRAGLVSTGGDVLPMFTQPICVVLVGLLLATLLLPPLARRLKKSHSENR
jgi:putative tricarboxylic transport membrane protein